MFRLSDFKSYSFISDFFIKHQFLSGSSLKIIAFVTMFIDHFAFVFLFNVQKFNLLYSIMRAIGRTAFPVFCFLLVEGFFYSHDRFKYLFRLLFCGCISIIPFYFMVGHPGNVLFTLAIGFLFMWLCEYCKNNFSKLVSIIASFTAFIITCLIAYHFNTDYSFWGITLIAVFYFFRKYRLAAAVLGTYIFAFYEGWAVLPSFILILLYNGKKGNVPRIFGYVFYPLHISVLCLANYLLC